MKRADAVKYLQSAPAKEFTRRLVASEMAQHYNQYCRRGKMSLLSLPGTSWQFERTLEKTGVPFVVRGIEYNREIAEVARQSKKFGQRLVHSSLSTFAKHTWERFNYSWLDFMGTWTRTVDEDIRTLFRRRILEPGVHAITLTVQCRRSKPLIPTDYMSVLTRLKQIAGQHGMWVTPLVCKRYKTQRHFDIMLLIYKLSECTDKRALYGRRPTPNWQLKELMLAEEK